jgi:hypothetical protein
MVQAYWHISHLVGCVWRGWGERNCCMKCVQPIFITITILSHLALVVEICTTASAVLSVALPCCPSCLCYMDKYTMRLRTVRVKHTQVINVLMFFSSWYCNVLDIYGWYSERGLSSFVWGQLANSRLNEGRQMQRLNDELPDITIVMLVLTVKYLFTVSL